MKPRKKWEPEYRFGGNPCEWFKPAELGTRNTHRPSKTKRRTRKGK